MKLKRLKLLILFSFMFMLSFPQSTILYSFRFNYVENGDTTIIPVKLVGVTDNDTVFLPEDRGVIEINGSVFNRFQRKHFKLEFINPDSGDIYIIPENLTGEKKLKDFVRQSVIESEYIIYRKVYLIEGRN